MRWGARALQLAFSLLPSVPRELTFDGAEIDSTRMLAPTRHGQISCHVYRSSRATDLNDRPPVYLNFHGGAFIVRAPQQDAHACRFFAATTGAVVVSVDYDTAPKVQYPVAEEQAFDVLRWVHQYGRELGWNSNDVVVGGFSAGAKLAINICQQARDTGARMPLGLVACYPALNMTLPVEARAELLKRSQPHSSSAPAVAPWLIRLMYDTYFADAQRRPEVLASPELDSDLATFPSTLILTGGLDSVAAEASRFAVSLAVHGVDVRHRQFENSDHGMTHNAPAHTARRALELIAEHISQSFARASAPSIFIPKELPSCSPVAAFRLPSLR